MNNKSEEKEFFINGYALETPNGAIIMTIFKNKQDTILYAEKNFDPEGNLNWNQISRKRNIKIVKVVVRKEKW